MSLMSTQLLHTLVFIYGSLYYYFAHFELISIMSATTHLTPRNDLSLEDSTNLIHLLYFSNIYVPPSAASLGGKIWFIC